MARLPISYEKELLAYSLILQLLPVTTEQTYEQKALNFINYNIVVIQFNWFNWFNLIGYCSNTNTLQFVIFHESAWAHMLQQLQYSYMYIILHTIVFYVLYSKSIINHFLNSLYSHSTWYLKLNIIVRIIICSKTQTKTVFIMHTQHIRIPYQPFE